MLDSPRWREYTPEHGLWLPIAVTGIFLRMSSESNHDEKILPATFSIPVLLVLSTLFLAHPSMNDYAVYSLCAPLYILIYMPALMAGTSSWMQL